MTWLVTLLLACGGANTYIVDGVVVKVTAADEVVIAHEDIDGLMPAMTMPFRVQDPALLKDLEPGDRILARFEITERGGFLRRIRETGRAPVPEWDDPGGPGPVRPGAILAAHRVVLSDGSTVTVGAGQDKPTLLTFLYTRCPMPDFCPATVARLQALQAVSGPDVRILAVTLDPGFDTAEVLAAFAHTSSAEPDKWVFGRAEALESLALASALGVSRVEGEVDISHGIRVLVLDAEGRLVERYDDHAWPTDRVLQQLRTGAPLGVGPG